MSNFKRPGTQIIEVSTPTFAAQNNNSAVGAFIGQCARGPVNTPRLVNSWAEFDRVFGGLGGTNTNYLLPFSVFQYFNNGGRQALVVRSAHLTGSSPLAALGTLTLQDRAGTPLNTLRVDANNAGVWGNSIYVQIDDSANQANYFDLTVFYGGTAAANAVERWPNLTMATTDVRYAPSIINDFNNGSSFITVTDLNSATAAPNDNPKANASPYGPLTGGLDGGTATTAETSTAISSLDQAAPSPLVLNLPGETTVANVQAAIAYAEARGDIFVVIDPAVSQSVSAVTGTYLTNIASSSSYAALYYPWVRVSDPVAGQPGNSRLLPPGGMVVGQYVATDTLRGVQKAPAGINNRLVGAIALETTLTNADLDTLNQGRVNAIKASVGNGIVIFGTRTLSPDTTFKYVPARRSMIFIRSSLADLTQFAAFEPNDFTLWTQLGQICNQFLLGFWQTGGLKGNSAQEAFYIKCDEENNTSATIAQGVVNVEVGVALQTPAEFVVIKIGQWAGGAATVASA